MDVLEANVNHLLPGPAREKEKDESEVLQEFTLPLKEDILDILTGTFCPAKSEI